MPKFSRTSEDRLNTCHDDLKRLFKEVIHRTDCTIICGYRDQEQQDAAYNSGASKVKWPEGKHNRFPSWAVDAVPYNAGIDWDDHKAICYFAGKVMATAEEMYFQNKMRHKVRWGGDWDRDGKTSDQVFNDLVHFELIGDKEYV